MEQNQSLSENVVYDIMPQGKVLQAYSDSRAFVKIIIGPLGSGKTIQSCMDLLTLMTEQEPDKNGVRLTRCMAVRNTYSELSTTTIKDWLDCHSDLGPFNKGGREPPQHFIEFDLEDGTTVKSELVFLAFDRPDHVKKARGLQLTWIWLNEVKELSKPVVDMLDLRHGRFPSKKEGVDVTQHGMIGDTNAPDEDHWLYRLAEEDKPEGWEFFKQPGGVTRIGEEWKVNDEAENINNLPLGYYDRGMQGKSYDWIKVNLANEYGYVSTGKPVHPRYIDSTHCKDIEFTPSLERKIILGFDFGRTPACAFIQKTSFGGWICFDEFLSLNMSALSFAPELAKYLKSNYSHHKFKGWGDPSGGNKGQNTDDTPFTILRAKGIDCSPTNKSNDPLERRSAIETPLTEIGMDGLPRLIILPKAKMARKGLAGGFCYRRVMVNYDEKYTDEPDKNQYSHIVEALEYGLLGEGEGIKLMVGYNEEYNDWSVPINA